MEMNYEDGVRQGMWIASNYILERALRMFKDAPYASPVSKDTFTLAGEELEQLAMLLRHKAREDKSAL